MPATRLPHILILPSWYPTRHNPVSGVFFREQAKALAERLEKVGILAPTPVALRDALQGTLTRSRRSGWRNSVETEGTLTTFQSEYLSFPKMPRRTQRRRVEIGRVLFERYVDARGMPDLIHCHSFSAGEIALEIQRSAAVPFITTEHSSGFFRGQLTPEENELARAVFSEGKANIAVSQALADWLERQFEVPFRFVPNVVDTDFFKPGPHRHENNGYRFLSVGLLDANKNHEMLVEAFSKAFDGQSGVRLTIVGEGRERGILQRRIRELNLEGQVELVGLRDRVGVRDFMQSSDALVLPSRSETFGVVLIEALSCGLPVVATRSGGPESIVDGSVGTLCEVTAESLAARLRSVRERQFDPAVLRSRALERFSRPAVCDQLLEIYLRYCR